MSAKFPSNVTSVARQRRDNSGPRIGCLCVQLGPGGVKTVLAVCILLGGIGAGRRRIANSPAEHGHFRLANGMAELPIRLTPAQLSRYARRRGFESMSRVVRKQLHHNVVSVELVASPAGSRAGGRRGRYANHQGVQGYSGNDEWAALGGPSANIWVKNGWSGALPCGAVRFVGTPSAASCCDFGEPVHNMPVRWLTAQRVGSAGRRARNCPDDLRGYRVQPIVI